LNAKEIEIKNLKQQIEQRNAEFE